MIDILVRAKIMLIKFEVSEVEKNKETPTVNM